MRRGDAIERFAKPIARGIDAIWGSDLSGCSGCSKMRDNLNAGMPFTKALKERFSPSGKQPTKGENIMDFQIQLIVEDAESVKQAMEKAEKGEGVVISVTPRPQQSAQGSKPAITGQFSRTSTQPT